VQRIVLDTDVVLAALRSPAGGSAEVVRLARHGQVRLVASVALMLEYEAVATRPEQLRAIGATRQSVLSALDFIAAIADEAQGHFRWRPQVRDPADEMVLEAAVNGRASVLMTFNRRDFGAAPARFGIRLCAPGDFLRSLRT
jgi:putative PIN family toxin of toxin-antitoxin system